MSKKVTLVSADPEWFESASYRANSNVVDIIAPTSWEVNTTSGGMLEETYLGNLIAYQRPFQPRGFTFNWMGTHKEINTIIQVLTRSSSRYFLMGNLHDERVITPSIMYDARAMIASVADNYRMLGEKYKPYLTLNNSETWNPGSYGVKVSNYLDIDYSAGVSTYFYVPGTQTVNISLAPVGVSSDTSETLNNIDFTVTVKTLGTATNSVHETELSSLDDKFSLSVTNAVVQIGMKHPVEVVTSGFLANTLNYIPPKITLDGSAELEYGMSDIPSMLTPIDDYVYNILSPNLAELSMNFQEVTNVTV